MSGLKPVYLVSGDDDAKIDEWRGRLRTRAESEGGPGALESFEPSDGPDAVAGALAALTLATSTRYILVDGVEGWKAGDLDGLEAALADPPPETVLVLIARGKPAARLAKAVEAAKGELREYAAPKPWELPGWVAARAGEHGLELDAEAAKALIGVVGNRPQQLAREAEKLAIAAHPETRLGAEEVERFAAGDTVPQVYALSDALVAGDRKAALAVAEQLRRADERPGKLVFPVARRVRDVHRAAELLDDGVPEQRVAAALKLPPWQAKRVLAQAKQADREALARAIAAFADLEVELRGGGDLDDETAFTLTLARAAG